MNTDTGIQFRVGISGYEIRTLREGIRNEASTLYSLDGPHPDPEYAAARLSHLSQTILQSTRSGLPFPANSCGAR